MLIRLIDIDTEEQLADALGHPVCGESRALYVTALPGIAARLAARGLPCIFREGASGSPKDVPHASKGRACPRDPAAGEVDAPHVYGVDLVICDEDPAQGWRADRETLAGVWKRHYHIPWTIAETERLILRESVPEDLPAFLAMYGEERGNPDVRQPGDDPAAELESYIRGRYPLFGCGLWSVAEKATGRVVGRVGFEETEVFEEDSRRMLPQLSYLIAADRRGQGYAAEAARAALGYAGQKLGFARVVLVTSSENTASRRLAARLGFQRASALEKSFSKGLDRRLIYVYDL